MAAFINALTLLLWKKAIVEQGVIGLDFSDFEKKSFRAFKDHISGCRQYFESNKNLLFFDHLWRMFLRF